MWEVVLCVPDRVNIPCLMDDTYRLCQLDFKMANNYHGTKSIRSKMMIKYSQVYIAFVLRYVQCFEKKIVKT